MDSWVVIIWWANTAAMFMMLSRSGGPMINVLPFTTGKDKERWSRLLASKLAKLQHPKSTLPVLI
jgi:hypothetical protein